MRAGEQTIIQIEPKNLLRRVEELRDNGNRLVQMHATRIAEDNYEINYSFDKDYKLQTLRLNITPETELPSITGIYWGAFMYENEIHELFGIGIRGINVDYKGSLYKKKIKNPFASAPSKGGDAPCPSK